MTKKEMAKAAGSSLPTIYDKLKKDDDLMIFLQSFSTFDFYKRVAEAKVFKKREENDE